MGFKRTSEGRVYFQSPEDGANDGAVNRSKKAQSQKPVNLEHKLTGNDAPPRMPKPSNSSPQTQMQIITLLKTLNERLKITQKERDQVARELENTRTLIENLQSKADKSEQAYKQLQKQMGKGGGDNSHAEMLARDALIELEETRKALLDVQTKASRADSGVAALKKIQADQAEKMAVSINHAAALTKRMKDTETQQEQMNERVQDALGQQARLSRKIDKAVEERARFMRKIERIEETVLQTRDSLNAKAMVLLTDQGVAGQTAAEEGFSPSDFSAADMQAARAAAQQAEEDRKTQTLQVIGVGLLVVAGLLGGWILNEVQKGGETAITTASIESAAGNTAWGPSAVSEPGTPQDMASMDWSVEQDTSAFTPTSSTGYEAAPVQAQQNDIGTLDLNNQQQVEALLSEDPDAVAAALNNIEPPNALPENIIPPETTQQASLNTTDKQSPPKVEPTKPAPVQKAKAPKIDLKPLTPKDPTGLIKPDASLPEVVQKVEAQAFEGVAEAQHDLAAIYTAGHGGAQQNYDRAAFWFEQAASRGVANAAYNLGVLNHQGLGMKADLNNAIEWYARAASLGHPEAQYNLGIAYIEGIGVPYDAEKAAGYFESAAANNIMEAAYNLGLIHENGLLGQAEPDKALVWYKTAADQGSPEAKQALEQLAKTLNVTLDDVNSLADSMKVTKAAPAAPVTSVSNTQAITAQIQEYLMRMGLYPGPADGITGPLTKDAIRSYQRTHKLQADGAASEGLLSHMLANAIGDDLVEQGSRAN